MREIDPEKTKRAEAFSLWMQARMPMVTLFQTLDVTALVRLSAKQGYKFNMLMCWCIGKAASRKEEFYMLPIGEKLMAFDRLAVNTVVALKDGGISTCDIPFVIWGRYRKKFRRFMLSVSFQFHHVQMDGMEAARFLAGIQEEISLLKGGKAV